jgi:hypothetical protein
MKNKDSIQAAQMRSHIESCKANGLTVTVYCKEHQLAPSTFYYWQKRLSSAVAEPGFTQFSPVLADGASATIHFPNGVRIVFSGSVSCSSLKELACCI